MNKRLMAAIVLPAALAVSAGTAIAAAGDGGAATAQVAPVAVERADPGTVVGGDPLTGGQAEAFVKIDGIAGESTDRAHLGQVDVKAFGFGGKNTAAAGGVGKVAFHDVTFSKLYDASSRKLLLKLATGQHIPSVTFSFRRPGAKGADFLTYTLSDVVVTSYEQGGAKERPLLEQVDLNFSRVQVAYTSPSGATTTAGWDVKLNESF
jgi:type VI secretion system secreted protein Hcp